MALPRPSPDQWFYQRYVEAVGKIKAFLEDDALALEGKSVADVGCGEGVMTLGIANQLKPAFTHGYDIRATDEQALRHNANASNIAFPGGDSLKFIESGSARIPSESETYDFVVCWSVLEHAEDPVLLLSEISRILKPHGIAIIQVWPFFPSEHGGHLWLQDFAAFDHLRHNPLTIGRRLRAAAGTDPTRSQIDEWESLNRLTLDDLQRALLAAGLIPRKVELINNAVHLTEDLMRFRLSDLVIGGIMMLASPRG